MDIIFPQRRGPRFINVLPTSSSSSDSLKQLTAKTSKSSNICSSTVRTALNNPRPKARAFSDLRRIVRFSNKFKQFTKTHRDDGRSPDRAPQMHTQRGLCLLLLALLHLALQHPNGRYGLVQLPLVHLQPLLQLAQLHVLCLSNEFD